MKLDELELDADDYEQEEEDALNALPRDRGGMLELLSYLEGHDSFYGWQFLLSEYSEIMTESEQDLIRQKVFDFFGDAFDGEMT